MSFFIRHRHVVLFIGIFIVGGILLASKGLPERRIHVVVTIPSLAFYAAPMIEGIGAVDILLPKDQDASSYILTDEDRERLRGADIILSWGRGVDDFVKDGLQTPFFSKHPVHFEVAEGTVDYLKKQKKRLPEGNMFWWNPDFTPAVSRAIRDILVTWDLKASGYIQVKEQHLQSHIMQAIDQVREVSSQQNIVMVGDNEASIFVQSLGYQPMVIPREMREDALKKFVKKYHQVTVVYGNKEELAEDQQKIQEGIEGSIQQVLLDMMDEHNTISYEVILQKYRAQIEKAVLK